MADRPGILQLTGMRSKKYGSLERYFVRLAQLVRDRGGRLHLQYNALPTSQTYLSDLSDAGAIVMVAPLDVSPLKVLATLIRLRRSSGARIVHTHFVGFKALFVVGVLRSLRLWSRAYCTVHNVHGLSRRSKARMAYNQFDHIHGVSDAVTRDLLAGGVHPARVSTSYLGLFEADSGALDRGATRRTLGIFDDQPVIGCIAFDAPFKGLDTLVDAMTIVRSQVPSILLLHAGLDPATSPAAQRAKDIGLGESVRWLGIIDDARSVLVACDIYVQPSRFGEGLPLAVMEAMASGLPVVATDVAGNGEAVADGENGLVTPPGDAPAMALALVKLLSDKHRRDAMSQASVKRVEQLFRGEDAVGRTVDMYDAVHRT